MLHLLLQRISFMKGAHRPRLVSRSLVPLWVLGAVLDALCQSPFEPIEPLDVKTPSLKTVFLFALASV